MKTTQDSLNISDITQDLLFLADGSAALVLETNAVNFGLLSEIEQVSIIESFAQLLNSLSFAIQIVVHSEKLDISSYLKLLDNAQKVQTNPLLSQLMAKYRQFIQSVIKENDVLDKQFYIVIPLSYLEIGLGYSDKAERVKRVSAMLLPRKDQLSKQLNRVGIKASQLKTDDLIRLFYNTYNQIGNAVILEAKADKLPLISPVKLTAPNIPLMTPVTQSPPAPMPRYTPPTVQQNWQASQVRPPRNHPFVVEELSDAV